MISLQRELFVKNWRIFSSAAWFWPKFQFISPKKMKNFSFLDLTFVKKSSLDPPISESPHQTSLPKPKLNATRNKSAAFQCPRHTHTFEQHSMDYIPDHYLILLRSAGQLRLGVLLKDTNTLVTAPWLKHKTYFC